MVKMLLIILAAYVSMFESKITVLSYSSLNRTNFCSQANAFLANSLPLVDGLKGLKLLTAINKGTDPFYMNISVVTGKPISGFDYSIQQIVAARGGFTFNYVVIPDPIGSYTSWLGEITSHVDLVASDWYSDTITRRQLGINFSQQIVDASLVLVTVKEISQQLNTMSFLIPFDNGLWGCIILLTFINGLIHWIIDPAEEGETPKTLFRSIYLSATTLTGAESMGPSNPLGAILNAGYSFFVMIIVATYTANLASTFIAVQVPKTRIASIDEANLKGLSICALQGTLAAGVIGDSYPGVNLVQINSNYVSDLMVALRAGECVGAVVGRSDWSLAEVDAVSNPECDLVLVGAPITPISGAWAMKFDYSSACTKYVQIVIDSIIVGMMTDGTISETWNTAITNRATINCANFADTSSGVQSLTPANMSGVVLVWLFFALVVCILWVYRRVRLIQLERYGGHKVEIEPKEHRLPRRDDGFSYEGVFAGDDRFFNGLKKEPPQNEDVFAAGDLFFNGLKKEQPQTDEEPPIWLMDKKEKREDKGKSWFFNLAQK